jgi:hypothetical protein
MQFDNIKTKAHKVHMSKKINFRYFKNIPLSKNKDFEKKKRKLKI